MSGGSRPRRAAGADNTSAARRGRACNQALPTQAKGGPMIFISDMLERLAVAYIVCVIYPAIRMAEILLQRNLLDDDD